MKKTLKTLALITTTWTVAEFITMWRMQDTKIPLKKYVHTYISGQKQAFEHSYNIGESLADGNMSGVKAGLTDLTHKKFYPYQ